MKRKQDLGLKKTPKSTSSNKTHLINKFSVPNINNIYDERIKSGAVIPEFINKVGLYKCCSCGKATNDINDKTFALAYSNLYAGRDYHLSICTDCLDALLNYYMDESKMTLYEGCRRICSMYDIYYSDSIARMTEENSKQPLAKMSYYLSKTYLPAYSNKTYANTLIEEELEKSKNSLVIDDNILDTDLDFWGFGFTPEEIKFLNNKYKTWTTSHECNSHSKVVIFQQICMLELQILKNMQKGESVTALQKQLNEFMNSGNLQPKQNNEDALVEANTFGTLIKKWENEKPISKPNPEWEDVDGIKKYISIWFLGHLANMIGIKNKFGDKWTKLYEDEIDRLSATPPVYFDEDSEAPSFEDVFHK
jgi:hypothetical protein